MQQAFGQAVDQTVSEFVRLGEAPSTALLELNDKYHGNPPIFNSTSQ
ncbi:phage tail length tape measure family protein [Paenalcaligenes hominis]